MPATLEILCDTLNARSVPCNLKGEFSSTISFTTASLSSTLRIAGSNNSTAVLVVKSREIASRTFVITEEGDLVELCTWVSNFQDEKERELVHGQLRPTPQSDAVLLKLLQADGADALGPFAPAYTMLEWGHLLDAVVSLFAPFGLQPSFSSADTVSFGVEHLVTNSYYAGPRISRFKKHGSKPIEICGSLNLSMCVTLLYARSHGAAQADADRKRMLSNMLVAAGYVGEPDSDDDFMPQKILLYDLSKADDRIALVERILLMRNSERKDKAPFEEGKWMGKQKSYFRSIEDAPCAEHRPAAFAYHLRKKKGRGSGLSREMERGDIDARVEEAAAKSSPMPKAGDENLVEWVLLKEQERVNDRLLEGMEEQKRENELAPESEEDDEAITPPDSPPRHAFTKSLADMGNENEVAGVGLYGGTLLGFGC